MPMQVYDWCQQVVRVILLLCAVLCKLAAAPKLTLNAVM